MSDVAANIKRIITGKGLKQSYIARKIGYSVNQFNAMLNNRKIIKSSDIVPIAKALDVEPNELFGLGNQDEQAASELIATG